MDFSNMTTQEEVVDLIDTSTQHIRIHSPSTLLTLTNIENMHFNSDIKTLFTSFVKGNKPFVKIGAVVGISMIQSFLYNTIMKTTGRNLKSFKSLDDAKNWIVTNSN
jgi:hypothetical protein